MKIDVRNPRTGQTDYHFTPPTQEELKEQTGRIRVAQSDWAALPVEGRIEALQQWKKALERNKKELTKAITIDTGRLHETLLEVDLIAKSIDRWCGIARDFFSVKERRSSSIPFIEIEQDLEPYVLVAVISPWNFPLLLSLIDTLPALLAGCTVIVKPSEITPRFIRPVLQSINQTPGLNHILTYIEGSGETGAQLIDLADLVCFTGSVATGRKVYDAASRNFIPAFLELGGKDPAIVLESADLDQASSSLLWGSMVNAGQSCLSIERAYVVEKAYSQFIELLVSKARQLKLAYPDFQDGQIGPIISDRQVVIIEDHLKDALAKGAKIHTGGKIEHFGGGSWLFPTILTEVNHTMKVMTEETFGPVLPVMKVKDEQEAIEKANNSIYGLSAAVFAGSQEEALKTAKKIQVGAVSINESALTSMVHEGEKNAFKFSGLGGTRMGPSAIKRFMRQKAFLIKKEAIKSPWWWV